MFTTNLPLSSLNEHCFKRKSRQCSFSTVSQHLQFYSERWIWVSSCWGQSRNQILYLMGRNRLKDLTKNFKKGSYKNFKRNRKSVVTHLGFGSPTSLLDHSCLCHFTLLKLYLDLYLDQTVCQSMFSFFSFKEILKMGKKICSNSTTGCTKDKIRKMCLSWMSKIMICFIEKLLKSLF